MEIGFKGKGRSFPFLQRFDTCGRKLQIQAKIALLNSIYTLVVDSQAEDDMEDNRAKKEVFTVMDEWKSTRVERMHSCLDCNTSNIHLIFPVGRDKVF